MPPRKVSETTSDTSSELQDMETLQQRHQMLHKKHIETGANLKNARDRLDELQREATEKYGTSDIDELRQKLATMKAENEEKRRAYQAELDDIERELKRVESSFEDAAQPGE